MSCNPCFYSVKEQFEIAQMMAWIPNCIYCMQNNYEPQYVVIAQTKEKTLKKLEKSVDFFVGICYYNTRLEKQGETY